MSPQDELDLLRLRRKRAMAMSQQQSAAPLNEEEQRAQRVRTAPAGEIPAEHGQNLLAGQRAEVEPFSETVTRLATGGARALAKGFEAIPQIPSMLYKSITEPAQVGAAVAKQVPENIQKLSEGTPEEVGEAAVNIASVALPAGKMAGAGINKYRTVTAPLKNLATADSKVAVALGIGEETPGWFDTWNSAKPYLQKHIGKQRDLSGFSVDARAANEAFDAANVNPIFDSVAEAPLSGKVVADKLRQGASEFLDMNSPGAAQKLEQLASQFERDFTVGQMRDMKNAASKKLRLSGWDDKTPAVREIARARPELQRMAAQRDGMLQALDSKLDEIAPRDAQTADIMRTSRDLRKVADIAEARAGQVGQATKVDKGKKFQLGSVPTTKGEVGHRVVKEVTKGRNHPDVLMQEATAALTQGKAGFGAQPRWQGVAERGEAIPSQPRPIGAAPPGGGAIPMTARGAGAQFEAVSQGMGAGRPGQRQLPAFGETEGSTYQALAGRDVNLNQRLLGPGQTVGTELRMGELPGETGLSEASHQLPGGFSQLSEIQPSIERLQTPLRQDVMAGQGYNPNQLFQGGRMADPAQQLQRQRMEPAQMTIGEAASQGLDVPLTQTLRYQGFPEAADFLENVIRNAQTNPFSPTRR